MSRSANYRKEIAAKQAAGDYPRAASLARDWIMGELAKVRRTRPEDAVAIDAEVTEKLVALAEAIPFYKPAKKAG